jgi:regulator of replication initiation timing
MTKYIKLLFIQDQAGSSEALQAAEEQLSQASQAAESLSAELETSQGESRRLRQEFEQQIEMLTQQLRDQVKETEDALQNALAAEKAKDKVRIQHNDALCGNNGNHHGMHAFDCSYTMYHSLN